MGIWENGLPPETVEIYVTFLPGDVTKTYTATQAQVLSFIRASHADNAAVQTRLDTFVDNQVNNDPPV